MTSQPDKHNATSFFDITANQIAEDPGSPIQTEFGDESEMIFCNTVGDQHDDTENRSKSSENPSHQNLKSKVILYRFTITKKMKYRWVCTMQSTKG